MRVAVRLNGNTRLLKSSQCIPICDALQWFHAVIEEVCLTDELRRSKDSGRSGKTLQNRKRVFQKRLVGIVKGDQNTLRRKSAVAINRVQKGCCR